jgi:hypothetical protein
LHGVVFDIFGSALLFAQLGFAPEAACRSMFWR